jgi:uncharacterized membrane protein
VTTGPKPPKTTVTNRPIKDGDLGNREGAPNERSVILEEWTWQGPLPPPGVLREINSLVPNGAERMIQQLEKETSHRHKLETRQQTFPLIEQLFARFVALAFAAFVLVAIVECARIGATGPAVVLGGGIILAGMNVLLRRSDSQQKPPTNSSRSKKN